MLRLIKLPVSSSLPRFSNAPGKGTLLLATGSMDGTAENLALKMLVFQRCCSGSLEPSTRYRFGMPNRWTSDVLSRSSSS